MKPIAVMALTAAFGLPAGADELRYDPQVLTDCLRDAAQAELCPGKASAACAEAEGGADFGPIIAMCFGAETRQWEGFIREADEILAAENQELDEIATASGQARPGDEMRAMQDSWGEYRHAAGNFLAARMMGGSGEGPEMERGHMYLTSEHAIWMMRIAGLLEARP